MKISMLRLCTIPLAVTVAFTSASHSPPAPKFEKALALKPAEGVFAYSRISPDGRLLAYASELKRPAGRGITQTVTIVDLTTKKTLFTEAGIDAYFSTDGSRAIYSSFAKGGVSMRNNVTGAVTRDVAPGNLGDYYSWAKRDGRDLILTITSNYYYLDGDRAVKPFGRVQSCPDIGTGDRPLISKDGKQISTFVRGTVVIRNLTDCNYTFDTGIRGAKTDFSWDGRYVAMHAPKADASDGYDLLVVDLQQRTVRNITRALKGSSYYPSWTKDGRLSFRYDGDDFKGFMFASDVLTAPAIPLPPTSQKLPVTREWSDLFPETPRPSNEYSVVLVYGTWSAHTPIALADLQKTERYIEETGLDVGVMTATDPGSRERDIATLLTSHEITLRRIPLAPARAYLTEITNQSPATLLFRGGRLIDRRLGAQSFDELRSWLGAAGVTP
jgi:hypothetical protein